MILLLLPAALAATAVLPPPERLGPYAERMKRTVEKQTVREIVGPVETPLSMPVSDFLLDHPDLSSWLVRRHKIAPYVIELRSPNRSWADDGDGTSGFIDLVDRSSSTRAYYTEGTHASRVFPDIKAAAVILMDLAPLRRPGCGEHVLGSFDVSIKMRSGVLNAMIKALRPFIKGTLIRKFTKAFTVARQVGVLLASQPAATKAEILSYPGFSASERAAAELLLAGIEPEPASCLEGANVKTDNSAGTAKRLAGPQ